MKTRLVLIIMLMVPALAFATTSSAPAHDKHGKIVRSHKAVNAFKREHPCPATGAKRGRCVGYVIDHVNPLACGGADAPANMQWQTVADGKAKDKIERKNCGGQ